MRSILEVQNLRGRTALVRVDFNVPLVSDGTVLSTESWRIEKSITTIKHLSKLGAKVVLISHIGRDAKTSLAPIVPLLEKYVPVRFVSDLYSEDVQNIVENLVDGEVILLENLRSHTGEEENSQEFAAYLARLADLYVNEAFSASHREHASIVGVPQFLPSYAGIWFLEEVKNLQKLEHAEKPFVCIIGGAKFETKLPVLEKFSKLADLVFVGGALANNFFKKIGFEMGKSLLDPSVDVSSFFDNEHIKIPFDVIVENGEVRAPNQVGKEEVVVDMGPETVDYLVETIRSAKTVLWNGPLGLYEKGFDKTSQALLSALATGERFSVVGGGDTVTLVQKMGIQERLSFVSTGGGAMLVFLAEGTLPGIQALERSVSPHL